MPIHYLDDATPPLEGRRVFCRVDLNVPMQGTAITHDLRIRSVVPTIRFLMERGARIVLGSHLGRPKRRGTVGSLEPVGLRLAELLGEEVNFIDDCVGDGVKRLAGQLKNGQILLLENLRFHIEEDRDDDTFARALAQNVDVYVNDAFACLHRAHVSLHAVVPHIPERRAGPLVRRELEALNRVVASRTAVALLGGPRLSDKIGLFNVLMGRVQTLCIGGAMAYTFLKAQGHPVGQSPVEEDRLKLAEQILKNAHTREVKVVLPVDHVVATAATDTKATDTVQGAIPEHLVGVDIGPQTRRMFADEIGRATTVFWNGTMGLSETAAFACGSHHVATAMADQTSERVFTVVVGQDTALAVHRAGAEKRMSHVSTGGTAALDYLEGKDLPALKALEV